MPAPPFVLDLAIHRVAGAHRVELSHDDPDSQARVTTLRGEAALAPEELLALQLQPDAYGRALADQVFADPKLRARFVQVEQAAQVKDRPLRFTITIDPSAADLQALRWELLRHPETGATLATSERVLLSRFIVSDDWRPVQLRARTDLVAVIAVAAPAGPKFARLQLAAVDLDGEVARARAALVGVGVRVVGGVGDPLTLDRLVDTLRIGVDLVYLVAHGAFNKRTGAAVVFLQGPDGDALPVDAEALCIRVAELRAGPRLLVIASCESAGGGEVAVPDERSSPEATLAGRLADAGVPAVVAMQGRISMATVEQLMPTFFRELLVDGQVDRALAAARGRVRERPDAWMPVLFSRLRDGKLWYTAGFRGVEAGDSARTWQRLLPFVRRGEVVPILGPELGSAVFGAPGTIARKLAEVHRFPLSSADRRDLPRVSQFIKVEDSRRNLVLGYEEQLQTQLLALHPRLRPGPDEAPPRLAALVERAATMLRDEDPADPFRLLAALDAPIYVTTGFDPLMELALSAAGRSPRAELGRWRYNRAPVLPEPLPEPTVAAPLVYHLFGAATDPPSLVLTEDDTFDWMMATTAGKLTPKRVESALLTSSLLILGFRLDDWSFRMLFRLLMSLEGKGQLRDKELCHVAVQLDPELQSVADVEAAKRHLARYFGDEANIEVYWGSARDFLAALHAELARPALVVAQVGAAAGPGGWEDDF